MKIVLIGAGNVAFHLGPLLKKKGHQIIQVFSQTNKHAKELGTILGCKFVDKASLLNKTADIYVLALKDEVVPSFLDKIKFVPKLIVHTSGSLGLDVFPERMTNTGVFYPLQTFTRSNNRLPEVIPFCIEGSNRKTSLALKKLAASLSRNVYEFNSKERRTIHLAAVFANNFVNHLLSISGEILQEKKIPFEILLPLIRETIHKIESNDPKNVQTGPARRGDKLIIEKHLKQLKNKATFEKIYKLMSKSIAQSYRQKR